MDDSNYYDRNKLYEEVWEEAVEKVARRYGVSGVALAKTCRKLSVPLPGRGYWAKKQYGKAPRRPPLPKMDDPPRIRRYSSPQPEEEEDEEDHRVHLLRPEVFEQAEKLAQAEKEAKNRISVLGQDEALHPMVQILTSRQKKKREAFCQEWYREPYNSKKIMDGLLALEASDDQRDRACRILSALVTALENRGYAVKSEYSRWSGGRSYVRILDQQIGFRLRERYKRRDVTKEEKAQNSYLRYVDEPSGMLVFEITNGHGSGRRRTWRDSKTRVLENLLNDIVAEMILHAAHMVENHAQAEKRRQEWEREEAIRRRRRYEDLKEEVRVRRLTRDAETWESYTRLQSYLDAAEREIRSRHDGGCDVGEAKEWLSWARDYVEAQNPLRGELPTLHVTDQDIRDVNSTWYYSELPKLRKEWEEN